MQSRLRVFVAGLAHESHRNSPIATDMASYEDAGIARGGPEALLQDPFLVGMKIAELVREHDLEVAFGLFTYAQPAGLTARCDYEALRDELLDRLRGAGHIDMVFLFLHGAMMADGYDDCEGDILTRIRSIIGAAVPVGVVFDLHGNMTQTMVDSGAVLVGCKEYPHIDFDARARQVFDIIVRAARGEVRPVTAYQRVPMLGLYPTPVQPMRGFVDAVADRERCRDVLAVTLCHGFPWSDWKDACASVVVVTDADQRAAQTIAADVADRFFRLYPQVNVSNMLSAEDAVRRAAASNARPVVIADASDNAGGGAASDSTILLQELLRQGVRDSAIGMLWDPIAVDTVHKLGVGATWKLRVGGKMGPHSGTPVDLDATVVACRCDLTQRAFSSDLPLKRTACIEAEGIYIVLTEVRQQTFDPVCFSAHRIDLGRMQVVVVKSAQHFHAQFAPLAAGILYADTRGTLSYDFANQGLSRVRRPVYPLDTPPFVADGRRWELDR